MISFADLKSRKNAGFPEKNLMFIRDVPCLEKMIKLSVCGD